jgi:hypothetical protein
MHTNTHTHTYTHKQTHNHTHTHPYTHIHTHTHTYTHIHTHTHTYTHMHKCTLCLTHKHIYIYIYIYIYIHNHSLSLSLRVSVCVSLSQYLCLMPVVQKDSTAFTNIYRKIQKSFKVKPSRVLKLFRQKCFGKISSSICHWEYFSANTYVSMNILLKTFNACSLSNSTLKM